MIFKKIYFFANPVKNKRKNKQNNNNTKKKNSSCVWMYLMLFMQRQIYLFYFDKVISLI